MSDTKNLDDAHYRQSNGADAPDLPPLPEPWITNMGAPIGSRNHYAEDQMIDYARTHAGALAEYETKELTEEVGRLQRSLCFWLPSVTDREDEVAFRILDDAFLLVGCDGNLPDDFKSAQELGWVSLAQAAPASRPAAETAGDQADAFKWRTREGKQHDTGRVTYANGGFFADTASPADAERIANALNAASLAAVGAADLAAPASPASAPVASRDQLLADLYEFTKYAACSQRRNTGDFLDGLFEQIERLQPQCAAALAAPVEQAGVLPGWEISRVEGQQRLTVSKQGVVGYAPHPHDENIASVTLWHLAYDLLAATLPPVVARKEDTERLNWLDQQGYAYGFEDMHEGNRWMIDGPFANLRAAIDAARLPGTNGSGVGDE